MGSKAYGVILLVLLVFPAVSFQAGVLSSSSVSSQDSQGSSSGASSLSVTPMNVQTYGQGLGGSPAVLDPNGITALGTGSKGAFSLQTLDLNVSRIFVPLGVKLVILDFGWNNNINTTSSGINYGGYHQDGMSFVGGGFSQQLADWLKVGLKYGISTFFFVKQFGYYFSGPGSWDQDVINVYPGVRTVNGSGAYVPLTGANGGCAGCTLSSGWTIASPTIYRQYEQDLKQLYRWYGNYSNWIGIGEGATGDRNYYASISGQINPARPYDNYTVSQFANSIFFLKSVDSSGRYVGTAIQSKIYDMFLKDRPDIGGSTGPAFIFPNTNQIYGTNSLLMRFYVPFGQTLGGFALKAYLNTVGSPPSSLSATIYPDNDSLAFVGRPVLTHPMETEAVTGVSSSANWVSTSFNSKLVGGDYYWVAFSSAKGDANNYYAVTSDSSDVFKDIFVYTSTSGLDYKSMSRTAGGSVLWIQDNRGKDVTVYPYMIQSPNFGATFPGVTYFQPTSRIRVNELNLYVSDRGYDPNNITISVQYPNGTVLATGTMSERWANGLISGTYVPFQLSKVVVLKPTIKYSIVFGPLPPNDGYVGNSNVGVAQTLLAQSANPCSAGYLGQCAWPIMTFGLMNPEPNGISNFNYIGTTDLSDSPGVAPGKEVAFKFTAHQNENLQSFSLNVIGLPAGSPASLQVTLRSDNATIFTHPSSLKGASPLASSTVPLSTLASGMRSCPTNTGRCTWANFTSWTGNTALIAGRGYWLVLNVTKNSYADLLRLVGPRNGPTYVSSDDFRKTWSQPSDGPSELSYQIVTNGESFNNMYVGMAQNSLGYLGQSFKSSVPFQLKGLWVSASPGGYLVNGSIRPDSGSDSPSTRILASGLMYQNATGYGANLNYISLNVPINVTAGTKYWFVVKSVKCVDSCSENAVGYANVYRSDAHSSKMDYGGAALHYEVSSNGLTWTSPKQEGDAVFILAGSNSTINTYNTRTLYNEIRTHLSSSVSYALANPWNTYLDYLQSRLMYNLTQYMTAYSGHPFYWFTGMPLDIVHNVPNMNFSYLYSSIPGAGAPSNCPPSQPSCGGSATFCPDTTVNHLSGILSAPNQNTWLPWDNLGNTGDNNGDPRPVDLRTLYLVQYPITARGILGFNDWWEGVDHKGLYNFTQTAYLRQFGALMSRMEYNGGYFGTQKDVVKVLWFTHGADEQFFPQFLTPVADVTIIPSDYSDASNLTVYGNLKQFNVIVGQPSNPTPSLASRLNALVSSGGGWIINGFGDSPGSSNAVLGLQTSSVQANPTSSLTIITSNPITSPYTSISYQAYWDRYVISPLQGNSPQVLVTDSQGNYVVTTNRYGAGRGVFLAMPYARYSFSGNSIAFDGQHYGSPRDSWVSLMINAIFYAAHKEAALPILWESSYKQQQPWSQYLQFSVDGSPGKPVLLWVSNNDSVSSAFDVHLNATFYGINRAGWIAVNTRDMSVVASGMGSDMHIKTTIPPKTWASIYLLSVPTNLEPAYTTASITSGSLGASSGQYVTSSVEGASTWLILRSTAPVVSVGSSRTGTLGAYSSLNAANSSQIGYYCTAVRQNGACNSFQYNRQEGWWYDAGNQLLYVHFQGGSGVTISVSQTATSSSTTTSSSTMTTTTTSMTTSTSTQPNSGTSSTSTSSTSSTSTSTTKTTKTSTTSTTGPAGPVFFITDSTTGQPIAGAVVNYDGYALSTNTNPPIGYVTFPPSILGISGTLTITAPGYNTFQTRGFVTRAGSTYPIGLTRTSPTASTSTTTSSTSSQTATATTTTRSRPIPPSVGVGQDSSMISLALAVVPILAIGIAYVMVSGWRRRSGADIKHLLPLLEDPAYPSSAR